VDITTRAKRIVFSGYFTAGAKIGVEDGKLNIYTEGKVRKLIPEVEHVSFSGPRAIEQGQEVSYITERCVMKLMPDGITVTELAPGVDLERDVLAMADIPLKVSPSLRTTDETLFQPEPVGFNLSEV
jgi:propionate CoA-transferase